MGFLEVSYYYPNFISLFDHFSIGNRDINVLGRLHLELIHGGTGLGDIQLVVVLTGHCVVLLSCLICAFALVGYRTHSFSQRWTNMRCGGW